MGRLLAAALGLFLGGNGLFMIVAPQPWYRGVPGVTETGPFNPHFVMDIGAAFLMTAAGLLWLAAERERGWSAAVVGTAFVTLHALFHLVEAIASHGLHAFARDLGGVYLPAAAALAAVWVLRPLAREAKPC